MVIYIFLIFPNKYWALVPVVQNIRFNPQKSLYKSNYTCIPWLLNQFHAGLEMHLSKAEKGCQA